MKTITPIKIVATPKEKLITIVNRAINNAYLNSVVVRMIVDGVECLVYPNDNFAKVIHYVKLQLVMKQVEALETKS
jgi:hypothetical protein